MFKYYKDLKQIIDYANQISDGKRYSVFFTNRSFLVLLFAFIINIANAFGLSLPLGLNIIAPDIIADNIVAVATAVLLLWGYLERALGVTRAVFNKKQAAKAIVEAASVRAVEQHDDLAKALAEAGVPQVMPLYDVKKFGVANS